MIPVVLIHRGESERYPLKTVIQQACKFGNEIVLIGNQTMADERIEDFSATVANLAQNYAHLSTNHVEFERFCIERWFILREWMVARSVEHCLYIDSDVLLFCNAGEEFKRWGSGYDFTLSLGTSPATSYFSRAGLYKFCDWAYRVYSERGLIFQEFERIFAEMRRQNLPGGICDMTLFKFYRELAGRIGEMSEIRNGATWDHNINSSDGYEAIGGMKAMRFENGIPSCWNEDRGEMVRFNAIHCQGGAKHLIKEWGQK